MNETTPLPRIGVPATRALAAAGINSLDDLRNRGVDALTDLHGVGPKAIRILKVALSEVPAATQD
jgi:hypothetical protein